MQRVIVSCLEQVPRLAAQYRPDRLLSIAAAPPTPPDLTASQHLIVNFADIDKPTARNIDLAASADDIAKGKEVAFDRRKGNCLACHMMSDGALPGNIGPPLIAMKARFPDKAKLRAQIWDATKMNPNTIMPPFGRQQILSEGDIDKIVEYVYTL